MAHAVELLFDPIAEMTVRDLWAQLESAGLPSLATRTHRRHRPHVSLIVAEHIHPGQLQGSRERLAARHLDVTLHSAGVFPRKGVLYLNVVPHPRCSNCTRRSSARWLTARWGCGTPTRWALGYRHCTLAQGLTRAQIARAIDLLHDQPQPVVTAHVASAGLLDTTTGKVLPLADLAPHP
jgi:hypothetical protein